MVVKAADEYRHDQPVIEGLWADTLWVSVVDREADIFGIIHFQLTNKGYARYESLFVIDGVQQQYGNKHPLVVESDQGPWTDGVLKYEVVKPLEEIRITFDWSRFAFDLTFKGRFPVFDYDDCVNGNPFHVSMEAGGHFEQAMHCTGDFEIRGGPCKGETRQLDSWSHRDHSWSARFSDEPEWVPTQQNITGHYWPSIQTADSHINVFGTPDPTARVGGFISDANGSRAILSCSCEWLMSDNGRDAVGFRYTIEMPDGETIHVRTGRKYGQVKLWLRGENDLENVFDCYEPFFDYEIEETGERGYGVSEYSVMPPWPKWLV
ncbi:MAG: hypothetical protein HOC70_00790 [Gammaproteobacteria bacterium]|jgi:hypothetical protein|nr:hypothetical protein [Gammaproteobacteria bacterium]MBT4491750.1 hypothetical protein [Gammaproteobacteria bacterium]